MTLQAVLPVPNTGSMSRMDLDPAGEGGRIRSSSGDSEGGMQSVIRSDQDLDLRDSEGGMQSESDRIRI